MPKPRCPNGTRRNKKTGNCESKSKSISRSKSNSRTKKTMKKELLGKKMPEAQIQRIMKEAKWQYIKKPRTKEEEEEFEKKEKALKELRFDRDLNLAKIYSLNTAYENATNATKHHLGVLIGKE
jgi:hypothetical protein